MMTTNRVAVSAHCCSIGRTFASAAGMKSYIGYGVLMNDESRRAGIVHFVFKWWHRVCHSTVAADVHGLVEMFDNAYVIPER